uniref:Uncharacterized protein n=1 Tax=Anguilla anguilla TaxID=7936 RepID=A0A0E9SMT9_ANGAN
MKILTVNCAQCSVGKPGWFNLN